MGKAPPPERPKRRPRELPHPPRPSDWGYVAVLENVAAAGGDLWVVLWQALRDVWLWSDTPAETRSELFNPPSAANYARTVRARTEVPELTEALGTFHLLRWTPHVVEGAHLAEACERVCRWAEAASLTDLAAAFAEAAAVADPGDPERAHSAARTCRRVGWSSRAALWYERTFRLAVRADNRDTAVGALIGYGMLLYGLGLYQRARPYLERGARRAARTGRRAKAAEAHHDLMGLCLDLKDFTGATDHGRRAEKLYPLLHSRVPALAHDFAVLLLRQRHSALALSLLANLPQHFRNWEAALVWSTLAEATAGSGRRDQFEQAERRTLELVALHREYAATALLSLARGARVLRQWEKAEQYVAMAREIAQERSDAGQEQLAVDLLKQLRDREQPLPAVAAPEAAASLARRLAARMRHWRDTRLDRGSEQDAGGVNPPAS